MTDYPYGGADRDSGTPRRAIVLSFPLAERAEELPQSCHLGCGSCCHQNACSGPERRRRHRRAGAVSAINSAELIALRRKIPHRSNASPALRNTVLASALRGEGVAHLAIRTPDFADGFRSACIALLGAWCDVRCAGSGRSYRLQVVARPDKWLHHWLFGWRHRLRLKHD